MGTSVLSLLVPEPAGACRCLQCRCHVDVGVCVRCRRGCPAPVTLTCRRCAAASTAACPCWSSVLACLQRLQPTSAPGAFAAWLRGALGNPSELLGKGKRCGSLWAANPGVDVGPALAKLVELLTPLVPYTAPPVLRCVALGCYGCCTPCGASSFQQMRWVVTRAGGSACVAAIVILPADSHVIQRYFCK